MFAIEREDHRKTCGPVFSFILVSIPDFASSFTCVCISGLSSLTVTLTTTAQSAYKAPGTRTSSGISNKDASIGPCSRPFLLAPSKLDVDAEGGELELDVDVGTKVVCESNLKGVGRNKTCKMD